MERAPLPDPKTPGDRYLHDIATSLRTLVDRDPAPESQVELREPKKPAKKATSKRKG